MCTDTIIRQVGDIGRMVDEFSSFARMPRPTVKEEDAKELCQQALFLQRNGNPGIRYTVNLPGHPVPLNCDRRQVSQVLTNILKNSAEAIEGRDENMDTPLPQGEISLSLIEDETGLRIVVEDNGRGLPKEGRERLTEPYMTTRGGAQQGGQSGGGLGLGFFIAKTLLERSGAAVNFRNAAEQGKGALAEIVWPREAFVRAASEEAGL